MKISEKIKLLLDNGIKVYPSASEKLKKMAVTICDEYNVIYKVSATNREGEITGDYKHTQSTINKALEDAIDYVYNKIRKGQTESLNKVSEQL
ncbi:hypothetical protein [Lacinutrix sp. Hel_I_90]|uniref:hypothetical protein n=1 Tax=Lacinutrix sp. Hel_I_90 TaxID=1249999 RepID=UPI0005C90F90|nr:hypothetical protein [Lacinutrix sp. Hel_I_90]